MADGGAATSAPEPPAAAQAAAAASPAAPARSVWTRLGHGVHKASRMTCSVALMYAMHTLWYALMARYNTQRLPLRDFAERADTGATFRWVTGLYGLCAWVVCCWLPACAFELLDRYAHTRNRALLRWKLHTGKRERSFGEMLPRVLANEMPTFVAGVALFAYAPALIRFPSDLTRDGFGHTFAWSFAYVFGYDVVFWCGHKWMHGAKHVFDATHALHHSSHATCGLSHHYMTATDYVLETVLPAAVPFVVFGVHPPAFGAFMAVGGWNGVVVHSGWDLPLCPAPHDHFLHHVMYGRNLALGFCDRAFGTAADGQSAGFAYADARTGARDGSSSTSSATATAKAQ